MVAVGKCLLAKPLLSKGFRIFAYSAVVTKQRPFFIESLLSNGSACYSILRYLSRKYQAPHIMLWCHCVPTTKSLQIWMAANSMLTKRLRTDRSVGPEAWKLNACPPSLSVEYYHFAEFWNGIPLSNLRLKSDYYLLALQSQFYGRNHSRRFVSSRLSSASSVSW